MEFLLLFDDLTWPFNMNVHACFTYTWSNKKHYAGEVWGFNKRLQVERSHLSFCKRTSGVKIVLSMVKQEDWTVLINGTS